MSDSPQDPPHVVISLELLPDGNARWVACACLVCVEFRANAEPIQALAGVRALLGAGVSRVPGSREVH